MDNKAIMINTIKRALLNPDFIEAAGLDSDAMEGRTAREDFVRAVLPFG